MQCMFWYVHYVDIYMHVSFTAILQLFFGCLSILSFRSHMHFVVVVAVVGWNIKRGFVHTRDCSKINYTSIFHVNAVIRKEHGASRMAVRSKKPIKLSGRLFVCNRGMLARHLGGLQSRELSQSPILWSYLEGCIHLLVMGQLVLTH